MDPYAALSGTEHFHSQAGELWCEGVRVAELAARYGTPLYVYSAAAIVARVREVRGAFGPQAQVCYAVKANSNLHLLKLVAQEGAAFDLVSRGELRRVLAAGLSPARAVFAGVAKDDDDIAEALAAGILTFNVESPHELPMLEAAGARRGVRVPVALRLNPDVDAGTHAYISTAKKENKFGLSLAAAGPVAEAVQRSGHLRLLGYHVHLGSQLKSPQPYADALAKVEAFLDAAPAHREGVTHYDLGGGFGVAYGQGARLDVSAVAALLLPRLRARALTPIVEPGRYLVADAGLLVTRVLGTKAGSECDFVLVDAAMNDLMRPALYAAEHPIAPLAGLARAAGSRPCDVVGPVCESSDFLGKGRSLPALVAGELVGVFSAGAYGLSMASNYNTRRRPAEVLVSGGEVRVIRRRERYAELWAAELDV
jgi:diaminopimelate decarboxylase